MKVKDCSDRDVSLSNLLLENLVSDLQNFCSNDVLIVIVIVTKLGPVHLVLDCVSILSVKCPGA